MNDKVNKIQIPEDWEENNFGALIIEKPKSQLKVSDATGFGNYPFFTSGEAILVHHKKQIDGENLFLATGGVANVKYHNGEVAYSTDTYALTSDNTNLKYLYYFLLNNLYYVNSNYFLGSGLKHLQKKDLKNHSFLLPKSTTEQKKIAEILSKVDTAIEQTQSLIAKYQRIKTGLMQDLLTKGIDENGNIRSEETHEFKDSELGRIPKEWECEKLPKVANISRGKFTPRPRNNPIYYNGKYPFIQTGDISNCNTLFLSIYTQTLNDKGIIVSKKFPAGTIVMTIAANIGDTAILGREKYLTDSVVGIEPKINGIYLELFLNSIKVQLENLATESAQKNINIEKLNNVFIKYPKSKNEQLDIANKYVSVIELKDRHVSQLKKLQSLKTGLMQDLLSGKKRVINLIKEKAL